MSVTGNYLSAVGGHRVAATDAVMVHWLLFLAAQNLAIYRLNTEHYNLSLLGLSLGVLLRRAIAARCRWPRLKEDGGLAKDGPSRQRVVVQLWLLAALLFVLLVLAAGFVRGLTWLGVFFLIYPLAVYVIARRPFLAWRRTAAATALLVLPKATGARLAAVLAPVDVMDLDVTADDYAAFAGYALVKDVLYTVFEVVYVAGILPMKFISNEFLYFDTLASLLVVVYLVLHTLNSAVVDFLADCYAPAVALTRKWGCFRRAKMADADGSSVPVWNARHLPYARDAIVRYPDKAGELFIAVGASNGVPPNHNTASLLFFMFESPDVLHIGLIGLQAVIIATQFVLLLQNRNWPPWALLIVAETHLLWMMMRTWRRNLPFAR